MAVDKFKFVSPGVFLEEIDESGLPTLPTRMGPMIVGRFQKGPSNRPVQVNSFKEFVQIFGSPTPGTAKGDIWRNGELTAPTYATILLAPFIGCWAKTLRTQILLLVLHWPVGPLTRL